MKARAQLPLLTLAVAFFLVPAVPAQTERVIAWNNLGMHCMDSDYAVFSLLPPYNTIQAQVIDSAGRLVLDPTGRTLSYEGVADGAGSINTYSTGKTAFWDFSAPLYGPALPPEMGLAGFAMPGPGNTPQAMGFTPAFAWFGAEGIPITPFDDSRLHRTYPMMRVVVRDPAGTRLASTDIVVPVSDEMDCRTCHGSGTVDAAQPRGGWVFDPDPDRDFRLNVLRLHDDRQLGQPAYDAALRTAGFHPGGLYPTVIQDGRPILCARCHASNALPGTGIAGIAPLTRSLHALHALVTDPATGRTLEDSASREACYRCHPGSTTQCLRGAMGAARLPDGTQAMQCQSCHGSMSRVADPARQGWIEEPACQMCHSGTALDNNGAIRFLDVFEASGRPREAVSQVFATNPDTPAAGLSLYRFSAGHGGLQCEACHGATHAEYPSTHADENLQSERLQGHAGMLVECQACHPADPQSPGGGPHGLHSISQWWVDNHADPVERLGTRACKACHGVDLSGSALSAAQAARSFDSKGTPIAFARGFVVGCRLCHEAEWPAEDILRAPDRAPRAAVFPLPPYDLLPPAPPYLDPQPGVLGDGRLLYYQVASRPRIRLSKTPTSVAIEF